MNPSKVWNSKLEAASFFAILKSVQAVCINSILCTGIREKRPGSFRTFIDYEGKGAQPLSLCVSALSGFVIQDRAS